MGKASRKKRERHGLHLALPPSMQSAMNISRHHDGPKISASLGELINPDSSDDMTLDQFRKLLMAGTIAWNLSAFDEPRRTEELHQFTQAIGAAGASDFETVIRVLIARKLALFPDDSRFIVAADVKQNKSHFHITAAAIANNPNSNQPKNPEQKETLSV